jgi:hypothetical protein
MNLYIELPSPALFFFTSGWVNDNDIELDITLPSLTMLATSLTGETAEIDIDIPSIGFTATMVSGTEGRLNITLPSLLFTAQTANVCQLVLAIPMVEFAGVSHGPLLSILDITLPSLEFLATMLHASTTFRCYVLNTENNAISEYDNFTFNSFCTFKGKHLAAGANGIMLLEGNKDLSTDINAFLNIGNNDFGLPNLKKISDAYFSIKGDGNYYLTVTSDDGTPHSYPLTAVSGAKMRNLKADIGKGKKGRFFELELSNVAGADFELFDINLNVELLQRKV